MAMYQGRSLQWVFGMKPGISIDVFNCQSGIEAVFTSSRWTVTLKSKLQPRGLTGTIGARILGLSLMAKVNPDAAPPFLEHFSALFRGFGHSL
jgi:hypothetical protein